MKKSKKFSFLVDEGILAHHHGVRRYVFSLVYALSKSGVNADIRVAKEYNGRVLWQRLNTSKAILSNNGFEGNLLFASGRENINSRLSRQGMAYFEKALNIKWSFDDAIEQALLDYYDVVVLAAPWVSSYLFGRPGSNKFYALAMDAIPNRYYFSDPDNAGLSDFAYKHMLGYKMADMEGDGVLCISEATAKQCASLGFGAKCGLKVLPSLLPPGYEDIREDDVGGDRERAIMLAAPFDHRKGLNAIPELLRSIDIDRVIIYGRPRCSFKDLVGFFENFPVSNVQWWLDVDVSHQIKLYKESKFLLFPSLNEGLGLPVIEAYACGASVLVSNISPLNDIALPGDILYGDSFSRSQKIKEKLYEKISHTENNRYAMRRWGLDNINKFEW